MATSSSADSKYDNDTSPQTTARKDSVAGNEIITICVGNCGIHMGNKYLSTIMNEHQLNKNGSLLSDTSCNTDKLNTMFRYKSKSDKYVPRAMFVDIDETSINSIKSSWLGSLIDDENFQCGDYGSGVVNWAKGHYTEGAEIIDSVMDSIRNEVEICDNLQGFNTFHSICGGVGGGLGTLMLLKIRDNYPGRSSFTYTVFPSQTACGNISAPFEIYNSILSFYQLMYNADLTFQIDNAVILNICKTRCGLNNATYDDVNWIIALILSGCTASFRFNTEPMVMTNMDRMFKYHTCFPRLHFLSTANSPYFMLENMDDGNKKYNYNDNVDEIINNSLDMDIASGVELEDGKILSYSMCYRSDNKIAIDKMNEYNVNFKQKFGDSFIKWMPTPSASCYVLDNNECYKKYTALLITSVINTTAITNRINWLSTEYAKVFRRKAFLHWYKGEGMDEMEFSEAKHNVIELMDEYREKENVVLQEEDDGKDDE